MFKKYHADGRQRFSIKKFKNGTASVLVATLVFIVVNGTVQVSAEETANGETQSVVTQPEDTASMEDTATADKIETVEEIVDTSKTAEENYRWLSDMEFHSWQSGYGGDSGVQKNVNLSKKAITLKVDGVTTTFAKGITVHANGFAQYEVESLVKDGYTRVVTTVGIDRSQGNKGNVIFTIQGSNDNKNWTSLASTTALTGADNAVDMDVSIEGYKYLRLWSNSNGVNHNDHAVFGGLRLVKSDYDLNSENYQGVKTLEEYDKEITKLSADEAVKSHKDLLNERELVNRLSYRAIQNSVKDDEKVETALNWLLKDKEALELFIEAGNIDQPARFMTAISKLYDAHKNDLNDNINGQLYKKMMIAAAVGWSSDIYTSPLSFSMPLPSYDIVERYQIMKELYDGGQFARMDEFKTYHMEHLRMVMNDSIANDELKWLNGFSQTKGDNRLNMWGYGIGYIQPNYAQDKLYNANNKTFIDNKYQLSKYGIEYGVQSKSRTWMVMESGGICWNTSRFGQNLLKSNGVATVGIFQPGHEAVLQYSKQNNGQGKWAINNNVGDWQVARTAWSGGSGYRMLLDWGDKSFMTKDSNTSNNASYILLAQAALDSGKFEESNAYNLAANSLKSSKDKIAAYEKALDVLNINLDSFEGLINEYAKDNSTTPEKWNELAEKVIETYTYYPYAMVDLLKVITPYLEGSDIANIDILKTQALEKATKATSKEVYQFEEAKKLASNLLGSNRVNLAAFSFDGTNANKIVMNSKYESLGLEISYSVDGGSIWTNAGKVNEIALTAEQVAKINDKNDLKIKVKGADAIFTINITKANKLTGLFNNDFENRLFGATNNLEVSVDGGETWNDYTTQRFDGAQKVLARYKANGTALQSDITEFTFKVDNYDSVKEGLHYITYDQMKLSEYSSQQSGGRDHAAANMLDGSITTAWHTKFGIGSDKDKFYTVEFNEAKNLSVIDYLPAGQNGRLKDANIYTSMDGKNWTLSGTAKNLANNTHQKHIILDKPTTAKFVKIQATSTYGNWPAEQNQYFSGKLFMFFENMTSEKTLMEQDVATKVKITTEATSSEAVTIYKDINYTGEHDTLSNGLSSYFKWTNVGNDAISSIKIPAGYIVTAYDNIDGHGNSVVFTEDVTGGNVKNNLKDFNDKISSILVEKVSGVTLYADEKFQGASTALSILDENLGKIIEYRNWGGELGNDAVSSIKIPTGYTVTFYDNIDGTGELATLDVSTTYVSDAFNDKISAVKIEKK